MPKQPTICAVCNAVSVDEYPYAKTVLQHQHTIRRYWYRLRTGRNYTAWLNQYWQDVEKQTGKTKKDYEVS